MDSKKELRKGFTTGSCGAAAAKAALYMLLTGSVKDEIEIITPGGAVFRTEVKDIFRGENRVRCAVVKDGGDDPDVTTGLHVTAEVRAEERTDGDLEIQIEGGPGVGRVTLPGLDQPVGNAAINRVPRQMIEKELSEVAELLDFRGRIRVILSVPGGEAAAERTFNPRLGIEGGISILGTTGIVEPMSTRAILDTIRVELNQRKALGDRIAAVSPGNYGLNFMKETYGYDLNRSVKCSNYVGDTVDMVREMDFRGMLLTGHIGKLIKVSGGIMNTHSKEGDARMELLAAGVIRAGGSMDTLRGILNCRVTEEALSIIQAESPALLRTSMESVMDRILYYLRKRGGEELPVECILYSNEFGLLAASPGAMDMLEKLRKG
ncbi:cobalt-precorrin-5B (C(1))-methyltransferase CbiD [Mogibacterium kristiansenii]|uniref:Cobalt-precorrin-5B C(1)-methyltransferase n=1 Tax=Mogibacterium kristiansenii TaxID=2606708 RepID=A0A6N7XH27_9FIRM|nr:cobalt-precorrin-5B (C(1))-methyltransferase CbiD [Mogibacterium kristiansenii]MST70194.1 cobalamin biosynthesis protein CbiD [Mogibacterium kristiansenii]